jgi:hypothetical protein
LIAQTTSFDTPLLRQLVRTGKAGALVARGVPGGFLLAMREGLEEQLLEAQRGHPRKFKRLESVASYLANLGAYEFTVDLEHWNPQALDV